MHVPSIREINSFFLMKLSSEGRCRSVEDSLDQGYGPRYLMVQECFPYLTVELRGISKSAFLREYPLFAKLKSSPMQLASGQTISNFIHLNYNLLKPPIVVRERATLHSAEDLRKWLSYSSKLLLRANVCKNRAKSKFRGHSQKIIFAHILSIDRHK